MSKIIPHSANGINWLLVEVPEDATGFLYYAPHTMGKGGKPMKGGVGFNIPINAWDEIELPGSSWEIVCKADSLTEVQWKEIIDWYVDSDTWDNGTAYSVTKEWDNFMNYETGDHDAATAKASGLSLLRSHGLKPETTLILKSTAI